MLADRAEDPGSSGLLSEQEVDPIRSRPAATIPGEEVMDRLRVVLGQGQIGDLRILIVLDPDDHHDGPALGGAGILGRGIARSGE
jgi:hypothetical protein